MEFVIASLGGGRASWNFYCARKKLRHLALINMPFFMQFRNGAPGLGIHICSVLANILTIIGREGRTLRYATACPAQAALAAPA